MASLKDHMYKRAAMQNGPGPKPAAKPAYTPQDSANFEGTGKRMDKDFSTFKRLYKSKDISKQDSAYDAKESFQRRADTMSKNPYAPTYIKRKVAEKLKN